MGAVVAGPVTFDSVAGPIGGYVAHPEATGRYPAIILLSGIGGVGPQYNAVAEQFAEEGIVGVVLDWMGREKDPPDQVVMQDIDACVRFLLAQDYIAPAQLALSGYCRGGTLALLGLGQLPLFSAGICFHGDPFYDPSVPRPYDLSKEKRPYEPFELLDRFNAPLLIIHGASDTVVPVAQIYRLAGRLNELEKPFELKLYGETGHAFTLLGEAGGRWWHPAHAEDAFREAVLYLRRVNGLPVGTVEPHVPGAPRVPVLA